MVTIQRQGKSSASIRPEWMFSLAFFASILILFLVSFTGRSAFGEGIKSLLTALSAITGSVGVLGGLTILLRSAREPDGRVVRLVLGGMVTFVGGYTVVHVLS